ncbi:hypothetical protein PAL_GLEAN10022903 [Pteropus alecto]|uniref:Uncharacterized protein n=1 Tax=Pteropus alecto TaxID=9402 RepID=L5K713_PTEAL|nr:hypothetical protein PAL_GLEAN10022903 [Pteropus alecto]
MSRVAPHPTWARSDTLFSHCPCAVPCHSMLALDWNSGGSVSPEKSWDKERAWEWVPHAPLNPSSSEELDTHQSTICWVNE